MLILKPTRGSGHILNNDGAVLSNAANVCICEKLNNDNTLTFDIPSENPCSVAAGRVVECDGEEYKILSVSENKGICSVNCEHMFIFMAKRVHIPSICSTDTGDFIGEDLYEVALEANKYVYERYHQTDFRLVSDASVLEQNGFIKLKCDIDYEAEDKTTLWNVLQNIISYAGKGEILFSSKLFGKAPMYALVERIGRNKDTVIDLARLEGVKVETDISDTITELWPYGANNMDITSASKNISHTPFIRSELLECENDNYPAYGNIPGTKSYDISDITESGPDKLLERALWDFDSANPDRIDVPTYNISGTADILGLPDDIALGDTVIVLDGKGNVLTERIIQIKRYPLSGKAAEVEIGRVKRDLFFFLNRLGILAQRYKNISANNGKVYGTKVTGEITSAKVVNAKSSDTAKSAGTINNSTVIIDNTGIHLLSGSGEFLNASPDSFSLGRYINISDGQATFNVDDLIFNNKAFSVDENGDLYFDGKKIMFKEV